MGTCGFVTLEGDIIAGCSQRRCTDCMFTDRRYPSISIIWSQKELTRVSACNALGILWCIAVHEVMWDQRKWACFSCFTSAGREHLSPLATIVIYSFELIEHCAIVDHHSNKITHPPVSALSQCIRYMFYFFPVLLTGILLLSSRDLLAQQVQRFIICANYTATITYFQHHGHHTTTSRTLRARQI